MKKNFNKCLQVSIVFLVIFTWIFSGWPQIWPLGELGVNKIRIPPEVKVAKAQAPIPAYRASGTFTAGTGAITPPYPASMVANDVCLLVVSSENQAITLTTANGFVEVPTWSPQYAGTAATNPGSRLAVFWKRTVGGDSAPVVADSGNNTEGVIHCFSGVITSGNPWDTGAGGNDSAANDTTGTIPGSTTTVDNTLAVLIISTSYNGSGTVQCSGWANANLANITERQDNSNTAGLGGGSCMATGEKATAGAYTTTTVTMAQTTYKGAISLALKPQLPTYNQSAYRLFNNADSTDVGTPLAAQDTAATLVSTGAAFRLRMLLHIGANQLIASGQSFKLQFAQRGVDNLCDTAFSGETYADVTAATVIAFNNNATPADGAALTANANDPTHGADTIVNQTYEELNNFTNSQAAIPAGQDGKWDFALKDNSAPANTTYCLRAVKSDGTILNTYSVVPQITTAIVISISVSDGTVAYGMLLQNATSSTITLSDTQIVTNNGTVAETFNVMGSTSTNWTLGATAGTDIYVHKFCTSTCATPPTNYTVLTLSYQTANTNVSVNATTTLDLMINTPNPSTSFATQSVDVIVQAVAYP